MRKVQHLTRGFIRETIHRLGNLFGDVWHN
jgi:hypothetical protein